jgi:hypothetical protein
MKKRYLWLIILFLLLVGCGNTDMPNGDGTSQVDVLQPETTNPDDYALDYGLELEHAEDDYTLLGERSYATGWAAPFDEGYILVEVGFNADGQIDSIVFDANVVVITDYFSYEELRAFAYKIMDYPEIDWSDLITYFDELFGSGGHNVGILHTAFMRTAGEPKTNMPTITHSHFTFLI